MTYDYVVVDSKLLAYNCFHRHEPITNFLNIVMRALIFNRIKYKKLVFAHDINKSAYRLEMYPDYKGHRKEVQKRDSDNEQSRRDEFIAQYKRLPTILKYIGLQVNHLQGVTNYEADDVINIIKRLEPEATILGMSLDADWILNVDERTHILKYTTNTLITDEGYCRNTYDMGQEELREAWAILGQAKDGIYGISNIGLKRWAKHFVPLAPQARYELLEEWLKVGKYGAKIHPKAIFQDDWRENWLLNERLMSFMELEDHLESDVKYAKRVLEGLEVPDKIPYRQWLELCIMELNEVPPLDMKTFEALQNSIHR